MTAAMGRQLKQSVNVFHSLILYLRLPARGEKQGERGEREGVEEEREKEREREDRNL